VAAARTSSASERYAWAAGIVYVVALLAEIVVALGVGLTQNDSAAKIASGLHEHRDRLLVIAYLSVVYATAFLISSAVGTICCAEIPTGPGSSAPWCWSAECSSLLCMPLATSAYRQAWSFPRSAGAGSRRVGSASSRDKRSPAATRFVCFVSCDVV
jgi:hypothetical protein